MKDPINIIIAGVGGQGNVLAAKLLADALIKKKVFVTVGDIFGASQRGGSVASHIRISGKFQHAPQIPYRQADFIVGFEPVEALRVGKIYAADGCIFIINPRPNYPLGVLTGAFKYPEVEDIVKELLKLSNRIKLLPANDIAVEAGNSQAANMVMLGAIAAAGILPITIDDILEAANEAFTNPAALKVNAAAVKAGYQAAAAR